MAKYSSFEEMEVYQKALAFGVKVYKLTLTNPQIAKDYGLKDQLQRAALSISNNIAEGFERDGNLEFRQFLSVAKGSAGETRSQIYRLYDCEYISEEQFKDLKNKYENLSGKIKNFITYLNKKDFKGNKFQ